MKKIILALTLFSCSYVASAQVDSSRQYKNLRYCAKLKDGLMVIVSDDKEITYDILTSNGTTIKTNGNIIKKDGVTRVLKEGECVDTKDPIVKITNKKKSPKENEEKMYIIPILNSN